MNHAVGPVRRPAVDPDAKVLPHVPLLWLYWECDSEKGFPAEGSLAD